MKFRVLQSSILYKYDLVIIVNTNRTKVEIY